VLLKSVTVVSSTSAWAVGSAAVGGRSQALVLHWDGKHWKVLPSPNLPSDYLNVLWAASATSRGKGHENQRLS